MSTKMELIGLGVLAVYNLIGVMVYGYYCAECKTYKMDFRAEDDYVIVAIWSLMVVLGIGYGFYRLGYRLNRKIHIHKLTRKVERTYKEIMNSPVEEGK